MKFTAILFWTTISLVLTLKSALKHQTKSSCICINVVSIHVIASQITQLTKINQKVEDNALIKSF